MGEVAGIVGQRLYGEILDSVEEVLVIIEGKDEIGLIEGIIGDALLVHDDEVGEVFVQINHHVCC